MTPSLAAPRLTLQLHRGERRLRVDARGVFAIAAVVAIALALADLVPRPWEWF